MVCCRGLDNNPVVTTSINCWFLKIVTCVKDRINKGHRTSCFIFENNRTLCLEDCLFAPDFKMNLVSISCLVEHG